MGYFLLTLFSEDKTPFSSPAWQIGSLCTTILQIRRFFVSKFHKMSESRMITLVQNYTIPGRGASTPCARSL